MHPSTFLHVASESDVIVGAAALSVRVVPSKGYVGYIDDVVVDIAYRRRGVAELLLTHLAEAARQLDCCRIELTSRDSRTAANQLYQKLGYQLRDTNVYTLVI